MGGRGMGSATGRRAKASPLVSSPSWMADVRAKVEDELSVNPDAPSSYDFGEKQLRVYTAGYDFIKQQQRELTEVFNIVATVENSRGKVSRDEFKKIMDANDYTHASRRLSVISGGISSRFGQMQKIIEDAKTSKF